MSFEPPQVDAFRRFVLLDSPGILAALAALDGGAVDEILTKRSGESARELGGEVGVEPIKARGKKAKFQRTEEELRRVRTEHSAAAALIDGLTERKAIGILRGVLDADALSSIRSGMVMQLSADVGLHPLFQIAEAMTNYVENAATFGQAQQGKELKAVLPIMRSLVGEGNQHGRILLDFKTGDAQAARIVALAKRSGIQVPIEDLEGRFSALAQVDEVRTGDGQELLTLRAIRSGAQPGEAERKGIVESTPALVEPARAIGIELTMDDVVMRPPLVLLRPIAVWR